MKLREDELHQTRQSLKNIIIIVHNLICKAEMYVCIDVCMLGVGMHIGGCMYVCP